MNYQKLIDQAKHSGSLEIVDQTIKKIPDELYNAETSQSDVKFYEANPITKLIIKNCPIESIESDKLQLLFDLLQIEINETLISTFVCGIENLTYIDLCSNELKEVPDIEGFPNLKTLKLNNNSVKGINLVSSSLTTLHVSNNKLASCELNCPNLNEVNLSNNEIEAFESNNLENCFELDLSHNKIATLGFMQFPNVVKLHCAFNNLYSNPTECGVLEKIFLLSKLQEADFSNNELESTPSTLFSSKSLIDINFADNEICNILLDNEEFWKSNCIKLIDLQSNNLQEVPGELGLLKDLSSLLLEANPLRKMSLLKTENRILRIKDYLVQKLPLNHVYYQKEQEEENVKNDRIVEAKLEEEYSGVEELVRLDFINKPVSELIFNQTSVENVKCLMIENSSNFSESNADKLGECLQYYISLSELVLAKLNIDSFCIVNCLKLERVVISKNRMLEEVQIIKCPQLQSVCITQGKLLDFIISECSNVKSIDLQQNELLNISKFIFDITGLIDLNVSENSISSIPSIVFTLTHLQVLNVSMNRLQYLPKELGLLAPCSEHEDKNTKSFAGSLRQLILEGNYLVRPSKGTISKGTSSILEYLRGGLDLYEFEETHFQHNNNE